MQGEYCVLLHLRKSREDQTIRNKPFLETNVLTSQKLDFEKEETDLSIQTKVCVLKGIFREKVHDEVKEEVHHAEPHKTCIILKNIGKPIPTDYAKNTNLFTYAKKV